MYIFIIRMISFIIFRSTSPVFFVPKDNKRKRENNKEKLKVTDFLKYGWHWFLDHTIDFSRINPNQLAYELAILCIFAVEIVPSINPLARVSLLLFFATKGFYFILCFLFVLITIVVLELYANLIFLRISKIILQF